MSLEFDPNQIKALSPINSLNPENVQSLLAKIKATEIKPGHYIFKKGDMDKCHIYVLEGEIELVHDKTVSKVIKAGSGDGLQPLAHSFPRLISARAKSNVVVTKINSDMLDIMLTWDQTGSYSVEALDDDDEEPVKNDGNAKKNMDDLETVAMGKAVE